MKTSPIRAPILLLKKEMRNCCVPWRDLMVVQASGKCKPESQRNSENAVRRVTGARVDDVAGERDVKGKIVIWWYHRQRSKQKGEIQAIACVKTRCWRESDAYVTDAGVEDSLSPTMSATRIFFARGAPSRNSDSSRSTSSRRRLSWFSRRCDSSRRWKRFCSDSRRISSPLRALASSCSSCVTRPL